MTRMPIYLLLSLIISSLIISCDRPNSAGCYETISRAESVLDSIPDSTLRILGGIDFYAIKDNRLLAKAHYLKGSAKMMLLNYPGAITPLLYAEKIADEAGDTKMLIQSRQRIMDLYDSVDCTKGTAAYAMRTIHAYEAYNDTSGLLNAMDRAIFPLFRMKMVDSLDYVIRKLESMAKFRKDSVTETNLFKAESSKSSLTEGVFSKPIYGLDKMVDSLNNNGDWKSLISSDNDIFQPREIFTVFDILISEGNDALARDLLDEYCRRYAPGTEVRQPDMIRFDKMVNAFDPGHGYDHPAYAIVLDRNTFFGLMIPQIERASIDFHYNEQLIKGQTIRHQHRMMWAIGTACALLVVSLGLSFALIVQRRKRQNEELIRSAVELKAAFRSTQEKWLDSLTNLCNTYL